MHDALVTELPAQHVTVQSGKQHVEDDRRIGAFPGPPQAVRPGRRRVDLEALGAQAAGDRFRQTDFVLDDQHAHAPSLFGSAIELERLLSLSSAPLNRLSGRDRHCRRHEPDQGCATDNRRRPHLPP